MVAQIVPFPLCHRAGLVRRQAHRITELSPRAGERHLARQLQLQRETLLRKGVAPEIVDCELVALERAIRTAIWSVVLTPGGAA